MVDFVIDILLVYFRVGNISLQTFWQLLVSCCMSSFVFWLSAGKIPAMVTIACVGIVLGGGTER